MKKSYLIQYQVASDGDIFNCHLIVNTIEDIDKRIHEHYLKIRSLYDDGNTFKFLPDSPKYYELTEIDLDVELLHLNSDEND